jgi:hypothetical protein
MPVFIEAMASAPFPRAGDHDLAHQDGSAVFVVPAQFKPNLPFEIVLYFHGFRTEMARQYGVKPADQDDDEPYHYGLDVQMEAAQGNRLLIAPQMAKNKNDGNVGKFADDGAAEAFLDEARAIIAGKLGADGAFADTFNLAPVVVASFSGGYQAAARFVAPSTGVPHRIKAMLMLDSLYGKAEVFIKAMNHAPAADRFFVSLGRDGNPSSLRPSLDVLDGLGMARQPANSIPKKLTFSSGKAIVYDIAGSGHLEVPIDGPPSSPLTWFLDGLPAPVAASSSPVS